MHLRPHCLLDYYFLHAWVAGHPPVGGVYQVGSTCNVHPTTSCSWCSHIKVSPNTLQFSQPQMQKHFGNALKNIDDLDSIIRVISITLHTHTHVLRFGIA